MEAKVRRVTSRRPWRMRHGKIHRHRFARSTLELESAVAVERERELTREQAPNRLAEQLAAPSDCQARFWITGEERREIRTRSEQHRIDPQLAAELAEPCRYESDGRALVPFDVIASRRPHDVGGRVATALHGGEQLLPDPAARVAFVDAAD